MTTLAFSTEAERRDHWVATAQERGQTIAELVSVLRAVLAEYPAFRSKPIGAPGSYSRAQQDSHIALEDRIKRAIERGRKP